MKISFPILALVYLDQLSQSQATVHRCKTFTNRLKEGPANFDVDLITLTDIGAWFDDNQFGPGSDVLGESVLHATDRAAYSALPAAIQIQHLRLQDEFRGSILYGSTALGAQPPSYRDVHMGPQSPSYFMAALASVTHASNGVDIIHLFNDYEGKLPLPHLRGTCEQTVLPALYAFKFFIGGKPWVLTIDD